MIPLCERCGHGSDRHTKYFGVKRACDRCSCMDYASPDRVSFKTPTAPHVMPYIGEHIPGGIPGWIPGPKKEGEDYLLVALRRPDNASMMQEYVRDLEYTPPQNQPETDKYIVVWTHDDKCLICRKDDHAATYSQLAVITNDEVAHHVVQLLNEDYNRDAGD